MKKNFAIGLLSFLIISCSTKRNEQDQSVKEASLSSKSEKAMYNELTSYIENVLTHIPDIPEKRKESLNELANYISKKQEKNKTAKLTFICTHNSRRSHLGQIWAATAAAYYELDHIETFSGGTEATAFNPRAVAAIKRAGFQVDNPGGENPHYMVTYADGGEKLECFSKKYDDYFNPQEDFAAIMTCSDADENCPFIPGASFRIPIPYDDPKEADGTDEETARYDERCLQIATEMFYLMSKVKA